MNSIWKIGVRKDMDLEDQRPIMFSNGIYFIAAFVLLAVEILSGGIPALFNGLTYGKLSPYLLSTLAITCIILNRFGLYMLARVLFILVWTFLVSVYPIILKSPTVSTYFFHPFYLILFSQVLHLLFSHPKDRYILLFFLLLSLGAVCFSVDFLLAFDRSENPHAPFSASISKIRIIFSALWFFMNLVMAYVLKTNWNFYVALREQKELISQQQRKLEVQNEELTSANQKLTGLNDQIHQLNEVLEKRVEERTLELTERNKILSDYAFMNAHLLRSPVSRIKGLINLFNITDDVEEKKIVSESLVKSAEELDEVVRSISRKLNEVN